MGAFLKEHQTAIVLLIILAVVGGAIKGTEALKDRQQTITRQAP